MKNQLMSEIVDSVSPEVKEKVQFEMDCLGEWKKCHADILKWAVEEGINISKIGYKIVNLGKTCYIKGVLDAYERTRTFNEGKITESN